MRRSNCTIYVGNLPEDVRESEIEDLFYKYGRILDIDLKLPPRPPVYCFIEFEDARDVEDAIRGRDGYKFDGYRLRVEMAHGGRGSSSADLYSSYSSGGGTSGLHRRSGYRVIVHGLPPSASWQDLKDHMRRAGDVCFAQVYRKSSGTVGLVDYTNYEDMKYAIRKLDDSEFRNPFSHSYLRVKEDRGYESSYSGSRSCSYSCSPSYGYHSRRSYRRSYSRSYSRSCSYTSNRSRNRSYDSRQSYGRSRSGSQSVYSRSQSRSVSGHQSYSSSPRSRSHSPIPQSRSRSVSWSRSPSRSRSRSHSGMRKISPSRSRSGSPCHVKDKSNSASRSRLCSESQSSLAETNSK